MINPYEQRILRALRKLDAKVNLSFCLVFIERLTAAFWMLFCWVTLWFSLWSVNLIEYSPSFGYYLVSGLFYTGFYYFLVCGYRKFSVPKKSEIYKRMEIPSRPIQSLSDRPANTKNKVSKALWNIQVGKWIDSLRNIKVVNAKAVLLTRDAYGISFACLTIFITALIYAGSFAPQRIENGLFPFIQALNDLKSREVVTVRIIPPEYTQRGEITLSGSGFFDDVLEIPIGSEIKFVVRERNISPHIKFGGIVLSVEKDPQNVGTYTSSHTVDTISSGTMHIRGLFLQHFGAEYTVLDDTPPEVSLIGDIEKNSAGKIKVPMSVKDDYGVTSLSLKIRKDPEILDYPIGDVYIVSRSLFAGAHNIEEDVSPLFDLTPHTWSGLPVIIDIAVQDHYGHSVDLEPISTVLPERKFNDPSARTIIEQRQRLAWAPYGSANVVSQSLEDLLYRPDLLKRDHVVFLGLRAASSRLYYSPNIETAHALITLLWKLAIRLEDGDLALLLEEVMQVQQELESALLDPNSSDEKIAELTQKLQEKLMEYMQALSKQLQQKDSETGDVPLNAEMMQEMLDPRALNEFLSEMADSAINGERERAKQMLSEFRDMMDSLSSPENMQIPDDIKNMMSTMKDLQEIIQNQQALLENTLDDINNNSVDYQRQEQNYGDMSRDNSQQTENWGMGDMPPMPSSPSEQGAPQSGGFDSGAKGPNNKGQGNPSNSKEGMLAQQRSGAQDSLRKDLNGLSETYSQDSGKGTPENFGKADQAMGLSSHELKSGAPSRSVPHQEDALSALKDQMRDLKQQLKQRMQNMRMLSLGGAGSRGEEENGPFGNRSIKIPEGSQERRIDDIIDLLRDKSGEWNRSIEEREYYKRLLRRF